MPCALVLPLKPLNSALVPPAVNDYAHAAFFALIAGVDAELAERLHGMEERKPFTLCPLYEEPRGRNTRSVCAPVPSGLRLTLLDDALFAVVAHALLANVEGATLRLGNAHFAPTAVWLTADAHPLAGATGYGDLCRSGEMPETLSVHFETPTVFRSQKRDALWPEPRLLWQSWARAWTAFAPTEASVPDEAQVLAWAAQVDVMGYQLQTQKLPLGGGMQAGFTGVCAYDLNALTWEARRILYALAAFAFYAGTGRKTGMGMGQTRIQPNRRREK